MKKIKLQTKLRQDGKKRDDVILWRYYGYGILNCEGECMIKDLPPQVKYAVFTEMNGDIYCVDGALQGGIMYKVIRNDFGKPVIEVLENESVLITKFLMTGETETVIKAGTDQKVKKIYKKLVGGYEGIICALRQRR